jgi:YbbR domain-containing protein
MASRLRFLTENLSLKLFSLAVAILLFLFVSVESATPVDVDFLVDYKTADDIMITNDPPQLLHTTLQGPWASLRSFDPAELTPLVIDLTRVGPGTLRRTIETSDIAAPGGMTVVSVRPSEIEIALDRKVERLVSVQVDITGHPAPGYVLEGVQSEPPRARVQGPMSAMQGLEYVYTRALDIDGRTDDFTLELDVKAPAPPLRIRDRRVTVSVQIAEEFVTRSFENLPVQADNAPPGTKLVPDQVSIKLKGPKTVVDALDPTNLQAFVDVQPEYDEGQQAYDKAVKVRGQPERTQWIGQAPKVQVQIPKSRVKKPPTKKK